MSKKLYEDQDINDLIESEEEAFFKGGQGSGVKGHRTMRDYNLHERAKTGGLEKKRAAMQHFKNQAEQAKARQDGEAHDHYKKLHDEASAHVANALGKSDINDLVEEDMDHEETFYKGRGPDKKKRKPRSGSVASQMEEINSHFGENMDPHTRAYLSQEHKIGSFAHAVRVNDIHGHVQREKNQKK